MSWLIQTKNTLSIHIQVRKSNHLNMSKCNPKEVKVSQETALNNRLGCQRNFLMLQLLIHISITSWMTIPNKNVSRKNKQHQKQRERLHNKNLKKRNQLVKKKKIAMMTKMGRKRYLKSLKWKMLMKKLKERMMSNMRCSIQREKFKKHMKLRIETYLVI